MPVNEEELDQFLIQDENELFWEFWPLFVNLIRQQHPDLPQLKSNSISVDYSKLARIFYYCNEHNQEPSPTLLMDATKFNGRLVEKIDDYYDTLSKLLLDCFNTAMQRIRIDKHTEELVREFTDTSREPVTPGNTSASPENQGIKAQQADSILSEESFPSHDGAHKFNPRHYGNKELCIVVSYKKAGNRDVKKLAKALTHKAAIRYPGKRYSDKRPLDW